MHNKPDTTNQESWISIGPVFAMDKPYFVWRNGRPYPAFKICVLDDDR